MNKPSCTCWQYQPSVLGRVEEPGPHHNSLCPMCCPETKPQLEGCTCGHKHASEFKRRYFVGPHHERPCPMYYASTHPVTDGAQVIQVGCCARCGEDHEGVVFIPLTRPSDEFTHWAACPNNGEPIMFKIVQTDD